MTRRVFTRVNDERHNEVKFLSGTYPRSVIVNKNAQGSGNKMFFDNPPSRTNTSESPEKFIERVRESKAKEQVKKVANEVTKKKLKKDLEELRDLFEQT